MVGAVDDGSGFSPGMEAMRLIKLAGGDAPKRSIAMILFAAEEHGLYGSKWYCDHPLFPIEKTAAMYNFDMVAYKKKKKALSNIPIYPKLQSISITKYSLIKPTLTVENPHHKQRNCQKKKG